ncbi:glycosyl hydrolase [Pseudokineococcus marinus]|uniref:glycosyl hydrolase n=1 Tax=Pseudokineococcus marinus TaxID=351215 RepID=UPI00309C1F26
MSVEMKRSIVMVLATATSAVMAATMTTGVAARPAQAPAEAAPAARGDAAPAASTLLDTGLEDPLTHPGTFAEPPEEVRPRTRWWWGETLTPERTRAEVDSLHEAGFGGFEVAFDADEWATQEQRDNLRVAVDRANELGMSVDVTLGAAWPIRTPNTGAGTGLSQTELIYGRADVAGGSTFDGPLPRPFDDPENEKQGRVVGVSAARVLERHEPARLLPEEQQPRFGNPIAGPERSTVLDPDSLVDLTDEVEGDALTWTAPEGDWIVFAYWARDAEESVMNHFYAESARAAGEYLVENEIGPENVEALRQAGGALFEDSLEHSAVSLYWSPDMAEQFKERRGYSPTKYLPLMYEHGMTNYWVPGPADEPVPDFDTPDADGEKVRDDYYTTITDLYVDAHMLAFQDWADGFGMDFKNQVAYGLPLEPVRSARELAQDGGRVESESFNSGDRIPWDQEDNPLWRYSLDHQRTLVGGAHQGGATRISTELGAQYFKTYEFNLADYKGFMDKEWAAGITLPFLHGYQYDTGEDRWPGTTRFGDVTAESWNDDFPQHQHWPGLTDYWARGTYVLEAGTPRTDVAVYRDGFLTTTARGRNPLRDEYGAPRKLYDTAPLEREGYSVQYLDPQGIVDEAAGRRGVLFPGSSSYRALVLDTEDITEESAQALVSQARRGLHVVVVGDAPSRASSLEGGDVADRRVRRNMDRLLGMDTVMQVATPAEVASALEGAGVVPRVAMDDSPVLTQARQTAETDYYYLYNPSTDAVEVTPSFASVGAPSTMDLADGSITPLGQFSQADGRTTVPLRLDGLGSAVIAFDRDAQPGPHVTSTDEVLDVRVTGDGLVLRATRSGVHEVALADGSTTRAVVDEPAAPYAGIGPRSWDLSLDRSGPEGVEDVALSLPNGFLQDWRDIEGLQDAAGVATYTGTFSAPSELFAEGAGAYLSLGEVHGSVKVRLNGELVAPDSVAGRQVDVSSLLVEGENELSIELASTLRNAVTAINGTSARTQAQGLLGPVQLIPYASTPLG